MKFFAKIGLGLGVCLLSLSNASMAATLLTVSGGTPLTLDGTYDATGTGIGNGTQIVKTYTTGQGLVLDGISTLIFTFLGKEAGNTNIFEFTVDASTFTTAVSTPQTFTKTSVSPGAGGFLPFEFSYNSTTLENGGLVLGAISKFINTMAFYILPGATEDHAIALALLNDDGNDADWDDMVVQIEATRKQLGPLEPVPVPAALPLLAGALGGLGMLSRFRQRRQKVLKISA